MSSVSHSGEAKGTPFAFHGGAGVSPASDRDGLSPHRGTQRRLQLIIEQLDQLPTLSSVAVRLLEVTSSEDSSAREVIELVSADPSLSSRVLQLVRRAHRGVQMKSPSIERAVVLLGFEEVRTAALSVEVFELLDGIASRGGETHGQPVVFDRVMFWRHCLAVAVASESLVRGSKFRGRIGLGEAFLAGLLHDLGQLAMYAVLPRTFDRVCELAEARRIDLNIVCRQLVGMDTHTIGRRLAEHWQLPQSLVEIVWLNGQPIEAIPPDEKLDLVRIVTLADLLARSRHLAHLGHGSVECDLDETAERIGIPVRLLHSVIGSLPQELSERAESLGLGEEISGDVLQASLDRASELLKRVEQSRVELAGKVRSRTRAQRAVETFFDEAPADGSLTAVASAIVRSASVAFGSDTRAAILLLPGGRSSPELLVFGEDASPVDVRPVQVGSPDSPPDSGEDEFRQLLADLELHNIFPDVANPDILELPCAPEGTAFLLRTRRDGHGVEEGSIAVLTRVWGAAIASAILRERTREMSEHLVEANRALAQAQRDLADKKTRAAVAEIAAGAAHEMNNPLTVISGRAQLLCHRLREPDLKAVAEEITRQSQRLSDLITSLRLYSEVTRPSPVIVELNEFADQVVGELERHVGETISVSVEVAEVLSTALFDPLQMRLAIRELLHNAYEAQPGGDIELRIQTTPEDDRLTIEVIDSGPGLSGRALAHAFDPFFSEKPAGRRAGLGLARAHRLVALNGGELTLRNRPEGGAVATIAFSDWRGNAAGRNHAA